MKKEFHQCQWDDYFTGRLASIAAIGNRGRFGPCRRFDDLLACSPGRYRPGFDFSKAIGGGRRFARRARPLLDAVDQNLTWSPEAHDGQAVEQGGRIGVISGPAQGLFAVERLLLNFLGRLSGIATLTRKYVELAAGTQARIFDTRKTTPGWRRLEKYAVRCGGGWNHRSGLFEAVLIKDNHLAWGADSHREVSRLHPGRSGVAARRYIAEHAAKTDPSATIIEVEVDTLEQLDQVLPAGPDIVLLDNMSIEQLREAVARREKINPNVELEASGGVTLSTVRQIAESGIERISVGALTHSAAALDFGLDWIVM